MPIFEFRCLDCDEVFEYLAIGSNNKVTCAKCGTDNVKKLMSACSHKSAGTGGGDYAPPAASSSSGGGCRGCSGGNCGSCH